MPSPLESFIDLQKCSKAFNWKGCWGGRGGGDVNDNPHIHPMDDKTTGIVIFGHKRVSRPISEQGAYQQTNYGILLRTCSLQ